ncbi:WIZ protein, partial [Tricholaema leucomelas]|nr:WIZ protein [Tricholaema leucomelas]
LVAMEVGSPPPLPKKSLPSGQLDQPPPRIGTKLSSPEPPGSKPEPQDPKTQSLTTCEVCGACFETRKGLSSHARSHLRQLGVAESESSGAPIDLLYELMKQKGKPEATSLLPILTTKKSSSPKDVGAAPRPSAALLALGKAGGERLDGAINKAIKSPPGFSKGISQPGTPLLKKVATLSGAPSPKNLEEKSSKLPLSPLQGSPSAQWPQVDEEGPLNLSDAAVPSVLLPCALPRCPQRGRALSALTLCPTAALSAQPCPARTTPVPSLGARSAAVPSVPLPCALPQCPQRGRALSTLTLCPPSVPAAWPCPQCPYPVPYRRALGTALPRSHHPSAVPRCARGPHRAATSIYLLLLLLLPLCLSPAAASGAEPSRDIRCEFCGEFFENRKGLSSHARSHLRQMGITEWYVNGSPIDTLREILKRRSQPRPGPLPHAQKAMAKTLLAGLGALDHPRSGSGDLHLQSIAKKVSGAGSPLGQSPTSSPPPTARKMFPGLSPPSLQKKLKQDHVRVEIKRELMAGGLHAEPQAHPEPSWPPREDLSPLNLSSRAEPVRDIRCEFCGEYFENRKGLSSHARSHLRQMGVTEWSVNGSPIDTLRELLKKKSKPLLIKKEPHTSGIEPPSTKALLGGEEGLEEVKSSPGKQLLQGMALATLGGRTGKPGPGGASLSPREISFSPLSGKAQGGFLTPLAAKRPLQEERLGEVKHKTFIQSELPLRAKALHEKPAHT